ncbi:MAG: Gfo/Idh/MocA family oxidoreductase [Gordonia sp. (in: high G+C Gram-positive bacteria)]
MTLLPVVVVGIHGHGRWHLERIARLRQQGVPIRLAGVVDNVPPTATEASLVGGALYASRLEAPLPAAGGIVIVCTPIHTHAALALTAARAGCAVLLEKPPTPTLAEFDALRAGLDAAGVACQIGFQSLGSRALGAVRNLITDDAVGVVQGIGAAGIWQRDQGYYHRAAWAGRRILDGNPVVDGALTNPFAHAIAGALALAQSAVVSNDPGQAATINNIEVELFRANDIEADDTSSVTLRTGSGLPITIAATLAGEQSREPYIVVHGTTGRIIWEYRTGRVVVTRGDRVTQESTHGEVDLLTNLAAHVHDPRHPLLVPPPAVRPFMEVMEAVRLAPDPIPIPAEALRTDYRGLHPRVEVPGIDAAVEAAAQSLRPLASVGLPWQRVTR